MCASCHVGKHRIRFLLHNSPSNRAIFRYLRGGALSYKLTTPSVCSLHSHPPPSTGRLNVEVCTVPKDATIYGGAVERSETEGEHLAALASSELFPFQLLITFAATTLVGIWSSCFAAACNTPYSARFSPRCIAHRARSARIPRKRGQLLGVQHYVPILPLLHPAQRALSSCPVASQPYKHRRQKVRNRSRLCAQGRCALAQGRLPSTPCA